MELRNIAAFLCVAENESFTRAAEKLGYAQSTVSVQIQQLEEEIGASLFERIGKRVIITPNGHKFMEYANQIVQTVEKAKLLGRQSEEIIGSLRVGIIESLVEWIMQDCILLFNQKFPRVSVETKTASGDELIRMLKHNDLDFVFLLDRKISEEKCNRIISAENIVFVTHPGHPLADKGELCFGDILRYPLILTERNSIYRKTLEEIAVKKGAYISPILEINNTAVIVKLLHRQAGISFLPEYVIRESIESNRLVPLPVEGCCVQLWCQMFYHENKWVAPQMNGLMQIIERHYIDKTFCQRALVFTNAR
ncbi:MAG: LysR family transcriptional regulator [Synergistaceae bacterium]|nr:LysR family transcriptional regulator [Synergistaceae bacterium]